MKELGGLDIYADWLEERGLHVRAGRCRKAARAFDTLLTILDFDELLPTGSQWYGHSYVSDSSDWDWFAMCDFELIPNGWDSGGSVIPDDGWVSVRKDSANFIAFEDRVSFEQFKGATDWCYYHPPATKDFAIRTFDLFDMMVGAR